MAVFALSFIALKYFITPKILTLCVFPLNVMPITGIDCLLIEISQHTNARVKARIKTKTQ